MESIAANAQPRYSVRELALYFFKLGYSGFGGPIALVGYMHRDLVEKRIWISAEDYKEGLALAQLTPGPLATQLSIYLGFVHYRVWGATVAGIAFVLPSFIMVVLLGIAYKLFGGLPWMQSIFYGVGAAVIGIITLSSYKLTLKAVGRFNAKSLRQNWLLWLLYLGSIGLTILTESEQVLFYLFAGLTYMVIKVPPKWLERNKQVFGLFMLTDIGFWHQAGILGKIAIFFTKAGAFIFGSGLAIVPFLHSGVVSEFHWLSEQQFTDAVAIAMITPGPVVITVGFIGYLVAGIPGALVAAIVTFLPCYLFTVLLAPYFKKISKNASIKSFVEGITATVIGALAAAVIVMAKRNIFDTPTALIAIGSALALLYLKKMQEPLVILIAAFIGFTLKIVL